MQPAGPRQREVTRISRSTSVTRENCNSNDSPLKPCYCSCPGSCTHRHPASLVTGCGARFIWRRPNVGSITIDRLPAGFYLRIEQRLDHRRRVARNGDGCQLDCLRNDARSTLQVVWLCPCFNRRCRWFDITACYPGRSVSVQLVFPAACYPPCGYDLCHSDEQYQLIG